MVTKTADQVAEELIYSPAEGCDYLGDKCAVDWIKVKRSIAQALTAYAEERVKEATDGLKEHWFGPTETDWGEGIKNQARAEALEEAAKVCENPKGVVSRDYIRYAQSTVAPEIRALKGKP